MPIEKKNEVTVQESDPTLLMIERLATNKDADISKLERIMEMRDKERAWQCELEFNMAFAEMQPKLPPIPAKGKGHNNAKYARKEDMNLLVNPILAEYGFSLSFVNNQANGFITTKAVLRHRRGHSISTELTLKDDTSGSKNVVQAVGSSQSYGERYTMKAILNLTIIGDITDDDGKASGELATDAQRTGIANLLYKLTKEQQEEFNNSYGGLAEIKKVDVNLIIALINKKLKGAK